MKTWGIYNTILFVLFLLGWHLNHKNALNFFQIVIILVFLKKYKKEIFQKVANLGKPEAIRNIAFLYEYGSAYFRTGLKLMFWYKSWIIFGKNK